MKSHVIRTLTLLLFVATIRDGNSAAAPEQAAADKTVKTVQPAGGKYQITIETTEAPDLSHWADAELAPLVEEWYPKIVQMLPSDGYQTPTEVSIVFAANMKGVAGTSGTRIRCAADWFRKNLKGEARGAVLHELIHVVQNYGLARREHPEAQRPPGWLVEEIPDYIRWFIYEPEIHGAEITLRNIDRARYHANYRISANFLNWVTQKYDKQIVPEINAAIREGKFGEQVWKEKTGHPVQELGEEWKRENETRLAAAGASGDANALTDAERKGGWRPLFNGKDFEGWHNFKRDDVRPGWQVKEGVLVCADPHNAGDLCTKEQFDWFELELEYNISHGGNSGIIYHVSDEGGAAWASGPEFQLEDNAAAADPVRCGWLYALYQPPNDPNTGKPLDATRPAGEWNKVRLLVTPKKCEHDINGVKYFEYVLGSDDFKARVAKSKFSKMPLFAKFDKGFICLQGDHGQVSFRNIKIRPVAQE